MPRSAEADPASPCTNICVLDPITGECVGCGRTIEEITAWGTATSDEKRAILERLTARLPQ